MKYAAIILLFIACRKQPIQVPQVEPDSAYITNVYHNFGYELSSSNYGIFIDSSPPKNKYIDFGEVSPRFGCGDPPDVVDKMQVQYKGDCDWQPILYLHGRNYTPAANDGMKIKLGGHLLGHTKIINHN